MLLLHLSGAWIRVCPLYKYNWINANDINKHKPTKNVLNNNVPGELFDDLEIVVDNLKDDENESSEIIKN